MPRGNDAAAAVADLVAKGGTSTNVEKLIAAQRAGFSPALEAAGFYQRDEAATAELDTSKYKVPNGHKVLDGSVRGPYAVYVIQDANGRTYKEVEAHEKGFELPEREGADALAAEAAAQRTNVAAEIGQLQAEAAAQLEKARTDIADETSKAIRELQEKAQKEREEAAKKTEAAEKRAAKDKA